MAIFDKELINNISKPATLGGPDPELRSPMERPLNLDIGGSEVLEGIKIEPTRGLTADQLANIPNIAPTFNSPFQSIPRSELYANAKYPIYKRGVDLEDIYGSQQSWYQQLANSTAKFGVNLVGTAAAGLMDIPNMVSAAKNKDFSKLSGNPDGYEGSIDKFKENSEIWFPNYMTKYEREHPFMGIVPFTEGSANFYGEKILKNLGYMVGAVASAAVQDAAIGFVTSGIGAAPLIAAQLGKASLYLSKLFTGANRVDKILDTARLLGKTEKQILNIKNLANVAAGTKITTGARYGVAMWGAAQNESGFEGREGYKEIRESLIQQYKDSHFGQIPVGADAKQIEQYAINGMNVRFAINQALLLASNGIQLDNVFKSFINAKNATGLTSGITQTIEGVGKIGLKAGSLDVFEKKVGETATKRVWEAVKPKLINAFTEGVYEEGGQYATEKGVYNYYTNKYKDPNRKNSSDIRSNLGQIAESAAFGLGEQFGSEAGYENMVVGAISALIGGKAFSAIDNARGVGKDVRLTSAINTLNRYGITSVLENSFDNTADSIAIAKEMQEAAASGNMYQYKNLKSDMFFKYVTSRLPLGMHDVTVAQLEMLKDLPKEEFEKSFGVDFNTTNQKTVSSYVDGMIAESNAIKETYETVNETFTNPFKRIVDPKTPEEVEQAQKFGTFEAWKQELAYTINIIPDVNRRLESIQDELIGINPGITNDILSSLTTKDGAKSLAESYEQTATILNDSINEYTTPEERKTIRDRVKGLRTASERINLALANKNLDYKTFEDILNLELNFKDPTKDRVISPEKIADLYTTAIDINKLNARKKTAAEAFDYLSTEEGFNKFFDDATKVEEESNKEQKIEEPVEEVKFKDKAGVEQEVDINREYTIAPGAKATMNKIADDRFEVMLPDGSSQFFDTEAKATAAVEDANQDLADLESIKVLAINDDGTIKIEDSKGNITNIPSMSLNGYEKVESEQEKLQKFAEQLKKAQATVQNKSGNVGTGDPSTDVIGEQGKLKDASILFISTTDASEKNETPDQIKPHQVRSREFLNAFKDFPNKSNIKLILVAPQQQEALGLKGLTELQGAPKDTVDEGLVAAVYVIQENGKTYFVDKAGNKLTEVGKQVDMNQVVFSVMPTTSTKYKNGEVRYRKEQKNEAEAQSAAWGIKRAELFAADPKSYTLYSFDISRGIAIENSGERNHAGQTLVPESKIEGQQGLVVVSEGTVVHQGETVNVPAGRPVIQYADTLQFLQNKKFSTQEANTIFEVMNLLAKDIKRQADANNKTIKLKPTYTSFLQNVLFWKDKPGKLTNNQIYIDADSMMFYLGGSSFALTEMEENKEEIVTKLMDTFNNVNRDSLTTNFSTSFTEFYMEGDVLQEREWTNYQSYLLSASYPDGSSRSSDKTPLTTSVMKTNDLQPYNYQQKYAILQGLDLPVQQVKQTKAAEPKAANQVGEFILDGTTVNEYKTNNGPVLFKGSIDENGEVTVEVTSNDTIDKVVANKGLMQQIVSALKAADRFDATTEDAQLVIDFLSNRIVSALKDQQQEEAEAPVVEVEEEEEVPVAEEIPYAAIENLVNRISKGENVSSAEDLQLQQNYPKQIEDLLAEKAKSKLAEEVVPTPSSDPRVADIERRRQEELSIYTPLKTIEEDIEDTQSSLDNYRGNDKAKRELESELERLKLQLIKGKVVVDKINAKYDAELAALDNEFTLSYNPEWTVSDEGDLKSFEYKDKTGKVVAQGIFSRNEYGTNTLSLRSFEITEKNKGIGQKIIKQIAKDNPNLKLISAYNAQTEAAKNMWDALVRKNQAVKKENWYELTVSKEALKNFKDTKGPEDSKYRRVGQVGIARMTPEEIELFKDWAAKNLPNIPYEILENIIATHDGKTAWGVFEDGVAKFYKSGAKGTGFHEMFEGVWAGMLSPSEQQALLDEFKAQEGEFTDRESGKKIAYSEATDLQTKERIADDFAEYTEGKLAPKTIGERILRFFKAITDFFKSFVSKPALKDELFSAINKGAFRERTLTPTVKNQAAQYRAVEGLTEQQTHDFVQDMTARTFQIVFGNNKSIFNPEKIGAVDVFNEIKRQYKREGKLDLLGERSWADLVIKTKQFLRTFKVDFDETGAIEINEEGANRNDYAPDAFTTDWKKMSPFAIKLVLATLTERKAMNQSGKDLFDLPESKLSNINGYKLLNFSRAFATVLDKLSNTTSVNEVVDKLVNLAEYDSNYVGLFARLGGNLSNKSIDFSNFDGNSWRLFINFYQTFTKQKPEALIQYNNNGEIYTAPADLFTAIKQTQEGWTTNIKTLAETSGSLIKYNKENKTFDVAEVGEVPDTITGRIEFLSNLGVTFPLDIYTKLSKESKEEFIKAVNSIKTYLGKKKEVASITGQTLGINGPLGTLAKLYVRATNPNQDTTHFNVENKRAQNASENNASSVLANDFNESKTLDELLAKRPELNDVFSANSQILKKGGLFFDKDGKRIKTMTVSYIEGNKDVSTDKGVSTAKLTLGSRFTQGINQNVMGNYNILIAADGSTEWMLNLGNQIDFLSFDTQRGWTKFYAIFKGYLKDDIALAQSDRSYLKNVGSKSKELRFFKDILSPKVLNGINKRIAENATQEDIDAYLTNNAAEINASVKKFIDDMSEVTKKNLQANGELFAREGAYSYPLLDDKFANSKNVNIDKFNLSEDELMQLLTFANANFAINNIEFHKILFGDPYQFKIKDGQLDETKRVKSFDSPARTTFTSDEYNAYLNDKGNMAGKIQLMPGDVGYHNNKNYLKTATITDNKIVGSLREKNKAYADTDESDAASWLMDGAHREVLLKNGQWTDTAEDWFQWEMAYTRNKLAAKGKYSYTNKALEKQDAFIIEELKKPEYKLSILKPIVRGNKYGKNDLELVLDKFSQMPVYYSMVEGTNLEELYIKMFTEKIDYVIVESGRKLGVEKTHDLYVDGNFNTKPFADNTIVNVAWKTYGIQVETSSEGEKTQTRGSQLTKLATVDLFINGKPNTNNVERAKIIQQETARNKDILDRLHRNAYQTLLNKLGLVDLGERFELVDKATVSQTLEREMFRRDLSDNAKDTVQLDENGEFRIPFEASPAYTQIRSILFSMVNKALLSPKMNGGAKVQVPVTMWEKSGQKRKVVEVNGKQVLTDDTLKFYTKEDPYCEVLLPYWFKAQFKKAGFKSDEELLTYLNKTPEGKKILTGVGFRIPTQALSSVEVFRVKGFLPQEFGDTVVVPSEITTKSGSDFDIDKLNMYLKAVYVDRSGNIRLIEGKGSEEATKEFYGNTFDDLLEKERIRKDDLMEAVFIYTGQIEDHDGLLKRYTPLLDSVLADVADPLDYVDTIMEQIGELNDDAIQSELKTNYVNDMYRKSLENEYYDSLEKLLTLPENFERLIQPNSDAGLKKISESMTQIDETVIPNRMLDRNYLTTLRNDFLTAKTWVGIAAVNITQHSLSQQAGVYLDSDKFVGLSQYDEQLLGDGIINLDHNSIEIGGKTYISIASVKDTKGNYISDNLSGYANAFVDVAKDPYIMKIIRSNSVVGTFMFLTRAGVTLETSAGFMNNPIIVEYLQYLDSIGTKGLFGKQNIKHITNQYFGNPEQLEAFSDFLKYSKMAEYLFNLTQATNYDTTRLSSNDTLFKKQLRTTEADKVNIFSSAKSIIDKSFLKEQVNLLDSTGEAIGEILKLEQDKFRNITDTVLEPYAKNTFLSADNFDKISNKIKASFLDYIIQTGAGLNDEIKSLLVDASTSVANQLAIAQKNHPEIAILKDLQVVGTNRPDGTKTVKLKANVKEAYDENLYTGYMRELRDTPDTNALYKNLVKLSIIQGTYQSSVSIKNIIPIEDYSAIIKPIIDTVVADQRMDAFSQGLFQRNNWKNRSVFGKHFPKFFETSQIPSVDQYGNDVYTYYSPAFPNIQDFNSKSKDRKVMLVSEKYNLADTQQDFLLVDRVVTDMKTGERIDMKTGMQIRNSDYARRKVIGDMSLYDVYGYQKVKFEDGTPLTIVDSKGSTQHVYKLINLVGDGQYASEYYEDYRPSVLNNGTVKIDQEIPNGDIITYYAPGIKENVVSSQPNMSNKMTTESGMITLKDGNKYNTSNINANMLEAMGYSPKEIGTILKSIC